jgi:hypothetical protein
MDNTGATPLRTTDKTPSSEDDRELHQAEALRRLTASECSPVASGPANLRARRRCRRAAGRSGGEFDVDWRGGKPTYRYVTPAEDDRLVNRLVACMKAHQRKADVVNPSKDNPEQEKPTAAPDASTDQVGEEHQRVKGPTHMRTNDLLPEARSPDATPRARSNREAFMRQIESDKNVAPIHQLRRKISNLVLSSKDEEEPREQRVNHIRQSLHQLKKKASRLVLPKKPAVSPVKDEIDWEADPESVNADANTEFFTPSKAQGQLRSAYRTDNAT